MSPISPYNQVSHDKIDFNQLAKVDFEFFLFMFFVLFNFIFAFRIYSILEVVYQTNVNQMILLMHVLLF